MHKNAVLGLLEGCVEEITIEAEEVEGGGGGGSGGGGDGEGSGEGKGKGPSSSSGGAPEPSPAVAAAVLSSPYAAPGSVFFPLSQLTSLPLPPSVDPALKEKYLSPSDFEKALGVGEEAFEGMPKWKQAGKKKEAGLF